MAHHVSMLSLVVHVTCFYFGEHVILCISLTTIHVLSLSCVRVMSVPNISDPEPIYILGMWFKGLDISKTLHILCFPKFGTRVVMRILQKNHTRLVVMLALLGNWWVQQTRS